MLFRQAMCNDTINYAQHTQVLGVTFDGASVNRRLIRIHSLKDNKLVYKVPNRHASDGRQLLFFSDPPHLVKTTWNCWASKARSLWVCTHAFKQIKMAKHYAATSILYYRTMGMTFGGIIL